ncbi:MAG: hypothetical protein PHW04_18040 [Candidatus Wallbacteria bacterium]|nr:hypothetical protein [Candidatus Wallbacteria bacterium]
MEDKTFKEQLDFYLIAGLLISLISFFLSLFGVHDEFLPYFYYVNFFLITIMIIGCRFEKGKMVATVTVLAILHIIYVYFFYPDPDVQKSSEFAKGFIVNIFLICFFYLFGFAAWLQQRKWQKDLEDLQYELKVAQKESTKVKEESRNATGSSPKDDLYLEKKMVRYTAYCQISEEIIKALYNGRKDFLQFVVTLLQTRLKIEHVELFFFDPSQGWTQTQKSGREQQNALSLQCKEALCKAVTEEHAVISSASELVNKYHLSIETEGGIIGVPIFPGDKNKCAIILEGFKDKQMLQDDERFCQRLSLSLNRGEEN